MLVTSSFRALVRYVLFLGYKYYMDTEFVTDANSVEFAEGQEAYLDSHLYENCPYPENTLQRHNWEEGWLEEEAEQVASPT